MRAGGGGDITDPLTWVYLDKTPRILAAICLVQAAGVCVAMLSVAHSKCLLTADFGAPVRIICATCERVSVPAPHDAMLLVTSTLVAFLGLYAAVKKHRQLVKCYGYLMATLAFMLGLTCFFTSIEIPLLAATMNDRYNQLQENADCAAAMESMLAFAERHSFFYFVYCGLCALGSVFAMCSNVYFDFEEVQDVYEEDNKQGYQSDL